MAKQPANKSDRGGLVSRSSMQRIGRAVAAYERGNRNIPPQAMPRAVGGDDEPIRIGKTTATWSKNSDQNIDLYEGENNTSSGDQLKAVNLFAEVQADRWVACAKGPDGVYYMIAAECD